MSPEEFSLIAAKPEGWQQLLFALAYKREIGEAGPLRRRWHDGLANEPAGRFEAAEYRHLVESKTAEACNVREALAEAWTAAVGTGLKDFNEVNAVLDAAHAIGKHYRALLAWKPAVLSKPVPNEMAGLRKEFSRMCDGVVLRLEMLAHGHSERVLAALIAGGGAAEVLRLPVLDVRAAERLLGCLAPGRSR